MNDIATGSLPSEQLAEQQAKIFEVRSPTALADEERSYATAKKWSLRQKALFVSVTSVVLWTLIILGVRQLF